MRVARLQPVEPVSVSPTRSVSSRSGQDWLQPVSRRTVRLWRAPSLRCHCERLVLLTTPQRPKARSSL